MNHQDKVRTRIYWQYKNSPKLIQLLMSLPDIAQSAIEDQLAKVKAMLDIDTAEGEQLDICGRIVGYFSRPSAKIYPDCVFGPVNDELFRTLIKAKIYRNNSIATIDEVKTAADYILNTETRCLDGQDMTLRMVWFSNDVSIPVQQLVRDYDLIPRPQGVGTLEFRVLSYRPFGFGPYYSNFRAPFWHGDGLHLYYSVLFQFSFDNDAGMLHGKLISEEVVISDLDVKLTITDADGIEKTVFVVTDENGEFSVQMEKPGKYTAVGQTQIITPDCEQAIVTSDPYDFVWHIYVTSITASVAELEVARGESATFTVNVLPENASNKAFTVHLSDGTLADTAINGNQVTVFGLQRGTGEIIITSEDTGMTARVLLNVIVVAETQFVMRIDSLSRPLFYVANIDEDFTIDYGDGVASHDYRITTTTGVTGGYVYTTRALVVGQEYTLLVKRSNTLRFFGVVSDPAFNSLTEILRVSGDRVAMYNFARGHAQLHQVHNGAFDGLEMCTNFSDAFHGCSSLTELPAALFAKTTAAQQFDNLCYECSSLTTIPAGMFSSTREATSFYMAFYGCSRLVSVPAELFAGLEKVTTFFGVFRGCSSLVQPGNGLFRGCAAATIFGYVFHGCAAMVYPGDGILEGCTSAKDFTYAFNGCQALTMLPDDLFADAPGGSFNYAFQNCTSLETLPTGLLTYCTGSTSFSSTFRDCKALTGVPDFLFAGLDRVTTFADCFNGCHALEFVGDYVFLGCTANTSFMNTFISCDVLTTVGEHIFQDCTSVTTFDSTFRSCSSLESMPLFTDCNRVTSFQSVFAGSSALKAIRAEAFADKTLVTTFNAAFNGCHSLESVGAGVFKGCSANTTFDYLFQNCWSLETVPGDIFEGCTHVTRIPSLFNGCRSLVSVPETLFSAFSLVTGQATQIFSGCSSLYTVPEGLLTPMEKVTTLNGLFRECISLEMVPEGLLHSNEKLVSVSELFYSCTALHDIPENVFAKNPLIVTFPSTFRGSGLRTIPEGLFAHNAALTAMENTFYGCAELTSVPAGLFLKNPLITSFTNLFRECSALETVGEGIFDHGAPVTLESVFQGCGSLACDINDLMPKASYASLTRVTGMFDGCWHVTGSGLALIDALPSVGAGSTYRARTFRNCTGLDDYADIPSAWK